jgi:hypothetical protein
MKNPSSDIGRDFGGDARELERDTTLNGWPEMSQEALALQALVALHSLTPSVRSAIIDLIRRG